MIEQAVVEYEATNFELSKGLPPDDFRSFSRSERHDDDAAKALTQRGLCALYEALHVQDCVKNAPELRIIGFVLHPVLLFKVTCVQVAGNPAQESDVAAFHRHRVQRGVVRPFHRITKLVVVLTQEVVERSQRSRMRVVAVSFGANVRAGNEHERRGNGFRKIVRVRFA